VYFVVNSSAWIRIRDGQIILARVYLDTVLETRGWKPREPAATMAALRSAGFQPAYEVLNSWRRPVLHRAQSRLQAGAPAAGSSCARLLRYFVIQNLNAGFWD